MSCRPAIAVVIASVLAACAATDVPVGTPPAIPTDIDASIRHRFDVRYNTGQARNVILFVGDGMDVTTVTAARILGGQQGGASGEENTLSFERLPHVALVKTYTTDSQVPDSAGTATAMLSGAKTRSGVINVLPDNLRGACRTAQRRRMTTLPPRARTTRHGNRYRHDHADHPRNTGCRLRRFARSQLRERQRYTGRRPRLLR